MLQSMGLQRDADLCTQPRLGLDSYFGQAVPSPQPDPVGFALQRGGGGGGWLVALTREGRARRAGTQSQRSAQGTRGPSKAAWWAAAFPKRQTSRNTGWAGAGGAGLCRCPEVLTGAQEWGGRRWGRELCSRACRSPPRGRAAPTVPPQDQGPRPWLQRCPSSTFQVGGGPTDPAPHSPAPHPAA